MLKVSKVFVHASQVSHSSKNGFLEFHKVSATVIIFSDLVVGVLGLVIVPLRYPWTSFIWTIVLIVLLHYIQFDVLNLSDLFSCSGIGPNMCAIVMV